MINNILTEILQQVELANRRVMAQTVEDANVNIQFDPDGVIKNLSNLSNEDQQTPELLIEKMCQQYTEIKTTDIFLDACCGRGAMLVYLHTYYNIPKDQLYGIELKEENVRLLNKLGYHNIILGDILDDNTWAKLYDKLSYNIKGGTTMKFDKVIMNPPYDGNLHLKILAKVLKECKPEDGCEVVNLSPARWLQDPIAEYKKGSDKKKFKSSIIDKLSKVKYLPGIKTSVSFGIALNGDLAIYLFNNKTKLDTAISSVANKCLKIFLEYTKNHNLFQHDDIKKVDGYRCEIKEILPISTYSPRKDEWIRIEALMLSKKDAVYTDGYDINGKWWSETRAKGKFNKNVGDPFPHSIKFNSLEEAKNFNLSVRTTFYMNLKHLVQYDMHVPFKFLPYMEDYSHVWTDEDYCKFFGLNEEESKFMCRTVDDYRVKDFINYEEF